MSSPEPVSWVLNLDAEDELARAGAHTPTDVMRTRIEGLLPRLDGLIRPGDRVLWPLGQRVERGGSGRAWCLTRWARSQLDAAGLEVPRAPSLEVLRRVNHRRFAHELGQALPVAGWARTLEDLLTLLRSDGLREVSVEGWWLLKRPFGYAGRGRRRLRLQALTDADRSWLEASFREGDGLQVEPLVSRELDAALHGWLAEDGVCTLGVPTIQHLDASGAWQATEVAPAGTLTPAELEALERAARQTASALHEAGYFGPFGLDAFRWRSPTGLLHFQPRSEVNARYSMGWARGMGDFRPPTGF
ncbi:MAG: hypothetical protein SFW67_08280 [Myxococcaceae bacterium]|nr:hypothetical protein [Myxococcaceae bacterium]